MITKVIRIGNSRGIRLPKSIIEQSHLTDDIELEVKNNSIIIKSIQNKRENWDKAFSQMSAEHDDTLLDGDDLNSQNLWDNDEWVW